MTYRSTLALSLVFAACGGTPVTDEKPVTEIGQSVYTPAVLSLTVENKGGGFVGPPPAGAQCQSFTGKYTLEVSARRLVFTRCDTQGADGPLVPISGSRVLADAEYQGLVGVLGNLRVVKGDVCGADKPTETLSVVTGGGQQDYGDAFYGCSIKDRPLVDSGALGQALSRARELSQVK